ncbi:MAG TPA: VOC family protein [Mycobacteriales bacterium]|jgi:predicted enzyme related to lactoylglutathione lyase|nr:VOC family protein [Mycobacteriales bacterium]
MASSIYSITIDSADTRAMADFWAAALGWQVEHPIDDDSEIAVEPPSGQLPVLLFVRVPDEKAGKNRLHFDLNPPDQELEVARLIAMGASPVDIGQGEQSWVVLADPEGNEFCVLTPRGTDAT